MNFNDLKDSERELIELLRSAAPYTKVEININENGQTNTLRVHTSRTVILKSNIGYAGPTSTN